MEDRNELLKKVELLELNRLENLTIEELKKEIMEWFNEDELPIGKKEELIAMLLADFMCWRRLDCDESLKEKISQYTK